MQHQGVGASIQRKEDERYLSGKGRFVGDIRMPGQLEVAFARSPLAHARIRGIGVPEHAKPFVYTRREMSAVSDILAKSGLDGFKVSSQPPLADTKVRFVGEPFAMCVGETRAAAEDIAEQVHADLEDLGANFDMLRAGEQGAPLIHEHWDDNVFLEITVGGDLGDIPERAPIKVTREISTGRQCMAPLEGKGTVAYWDRHMQQLVLYTSTQMPHIVRAGLSECLGLDQRQIRVVAPDVGGGFGWKGMLQPEEVCLGWLAMQFDRPVRWLEDRREHLMAAANCREHHYVVTAFAERDGALLAIDATAYVDSGAYSIYPFSACLEAAQVGSILPGPYDFPAYRCRTRSVCTNKPPIVPYRGVARTGVCFAMELMIDAVAREVGLEPYEVRMRNLVKPEQMPFRNITGKDFDMGDYPECLQRVVQAIDLEGIRARQREGRDELGRRIGVGFAIYTEQGAHGTSVYHGWGIPMVPGFEQAGVRMTPDGTLEVRVGNQSHGQSMETTLAQVAFEVLGIAPAQVNVVHGDTALSPYSTGTWGSRSAVMVGGAVATACEKLAERLLHIGAHLLQVDKADATIKDGCVTSGDGSVSFADIAFTFYRAPQDLPADVNPDGLEILAGYRPKVDTGTFSYAAHGAVVAVDDAIGHVELLDYVIVEDGGRLINPMVVDGQIYGGYAQGIGTALLEEMPFDESGQPRATTLADYMLPGAPDVPAPRLQHMETPSPNTYFGQKGIGEGGAIAPPAAIANAVNDSLTEVGVELTVSPITPRRIVDALISAETGTE